MIVIENTNKASNAIGISLLASNIEVVGWDSSLIPLYKMLEEKKPNVLIYGQKSRMNGSEHIKQKFPNLTLVYVGDDPIGETEPDLIIGKSSTRKCVEFPEQIYDITNILSGVKSPIMDCKICCFTDHISQDRVEHISDIMLDLFERKVRFFGNVKLDTHNYLGVVSEQERSDIIKSADMYVDLSEDYWHRSVMLGTPPIVFADKHIPGINTFTDKKTLEEAIEMTLKGSCDLSLAREWIIKNTGFDFCASILSALGAEEGERAVMQSKEKFI
tara:strand:+ start:3591 stop:4409 length:819 start_codon:yes stop_codon:yes gene_type:complete